MGLPASSRRLSRRRDSAKGSTRPECTPAPIGAKPGPAFPTGGQADRRRTSRPPEPSVPAPSVADSHPGRTWLGSRFPSARSASHRLRDTGRSGQPSRGRIAERLRTAATTGSRGRGRTRPHARPVDGVGRRRSAGARRRRDECEPDGQSRDHRPSLERSRKIILEGTASMSRIPHTSPRRRGGVRRSTRNISPGVTCRLPFWRCGPPPPSHGHWKASRATRWRFKTGLTDPRETYRPSEADIGLRTGGVLPRNRPSETGGKRPSESRGDGAEVVDRPGGSAVRVRSAVRSWAAGNEDLADPSAGSGPETIDQPIHLGAIRREVGSADVDGRTTLF